DVQVGASQRCFPMRKPWPFIAQRRDPLQIASPDHLRGSTRRAIQRQFLHALGHYLHVVWPVLFGILSWQLGLGILIAWIERCSLGEGCPSPSSRGLPSATVTWCRFSLCLGSWPSSSVYWARY